MTPRSTRLTGISGSWTSVSASHRRCVIKAGRCGGVGGSSAPMRPIFGLISCANRLRIYGMRALRSSENTPGRPAAKPREGPLDHRISRRRAASLCPVLVMRLAELVELLLEHRDHLGVARAARAPAHEHVVPGAWLLEVPPLFFGVELARKRIVELPDVLAIAHLFVRGHLDADLLAIGDHRREPPLAELVVGQSLEAVLELGGMHLHVVGEAEPFDAEREHPVDRALQLLFRRAARGADALHPCASVAKVEVLLGHDLVEAALPRSIGALVVDVAKEAEAGLVVHAVGDHPLGAAVDRDTEAVRVAEALGVAAENQLLLVLAEVLEDVVRDVSVGELVLDDRDPGHEGA